MGLRDITSHPDPESGITAAQYERLQARIKANRDAKLRQRDIEYRRALGLAPGEELPKQLGNTGGAIAGNKSLHFRGTKRPA